MVYSNKFVVCVLVDGKPQQEMANGVVKLPFGAEYSLRFRNKNNRRAVVKIFIDGENVSGGGYVIPAHGYADVHRHNEVDRAFKFVSLDSEEAVDHGKNGPNTDKVKGTVEARFYLEKERADTYVPWYHQVHYYPPVIRSERRDRKERRVKWGGTIQPASMPSQFANDDLQWSSNNSVSPTENMCSTTSLGFCDQMSAGSTVQNNELMDGCTVEGDSTGQKFSSIYIDVEDTYTSLKIFLQGYESTEEPPVKRPKSVEKSHKSKSANKNRIDDLEAENEELRQKIAELENEKLKKKLEELSK